MFKEFKEFAMKGNLIDMAVGLVMGAGFGKVAAAFTDGLIMPMVGMLIGGVDFKNLKFVLKEKGMDGKTEIPEVAIKYGEFANACVDFLIVAFVMYLVVKAVNAARKDTVLAPPPPSPQEVLLTEIRDALKKQR
ncbi:MAG: large-conductance mechanosensitive channel [Bacteroidota bacterium]|jgi:large conductance mechanosensitive channel